MYTSLKNRSLSPFFYFISLILIKRFITQPTEHLYKSSRNVSTLLLLLTSLYILLYYFLSRFSNERKKGCIRGEITCQVTRERPSICRRLGDITRNWFTLLRHVKKKKKGARDTDRWRLYWVPETNAGAQVSLSLFPPSSVVPHLVNEALRYM